MDQLNNVAVQLYGETGRIVPDVALRGLYEDIDSYFSILQTNTVSVLEIRELAWIVFLEVIDQLRHTPYIVFLHLLVLQKLTYQLTKIMQLQQFLHLIGYIGDIAMQELGDQLVFGFKIDVESLLRHAEFMTDIVYGNTTDTEAKKHLACRLNNITFLIFRHSYRKKAHKSTAFF